MLISVAFATIKWQDSADRRQARVLTAVENFVPPVAELWYDAGGDLERAREIVKERAKQTTERAAEALRPSGLSVETVVRDGDLRSVIVDEAKEWSTDLIIVGSHGCGLKAGQPTPNVAKSHIDQNFNLSVGFRPMFSSLVTERINSRFYLPLIPYSPAIARQT